MEPNVGEECLKQLSEQHSLLKQLLAQQLTSHSLLESSFAKLPQHFKELSRELVQPVLPRPEVGGRISHESQGPPTYGAESRDQKEIAVESTRDGLQATLQAFNWSSELSAKCSPDLRRSNTAITNTSGPVAFRDEKGLKDEFARMSTVMSPKNAPRDIPRWRQHVVDLVRNHRFDLFVSSMILFCSCAMAAEAEWSLRNVSIEKPPMFRILDILFAAGFACELVLRIVAEGCFFLSRHNPVFNWNVVDSFLVVSSVIEELLVVMSLTTSVDLSAVRMVRIMRLVRVIRVIRVVRFFTDLRIMVNGILSSARILGWALILLILIMFTFAVTLMQIVEGQVRDTDDPGNSTLLHYYGSLSRTHLTLFMAISGGLDWKDAANPLVAIHESVEVIFALYVFFTVFCCFNIVTGIFVDNAMKLKQDDEDTMVRETAETRKRFLKEVSMLFQRLAATSEDNEVTFESFQEALGDIRIQACLDKLGLNTLYTSARDLYDVLDFGEGGILDPEQFVVGIRKFNGPARALDIYKLRKETSALKRQIKSLRQMKNSSAGFMAGLSTKAHQEAFSNGKQFPSEFDDLPETNSREGHPAWQHPLQPSVDVS